MARKKAPGHAKRFTSFGVYFDESGREHEIPDPLTGKKIQTGQFAYVFTAAVIKTTHKEFLEGQLLELRREITLEILKVAPHLKDHKSLQGGRLIEIHAVDLYQSGGIYREVKRILPDFWHKQHAWLERALEIGSHPGIKYHFFTSSTEQAENSWRNHSDFNFTLSKYLPYQSVKDKLNKLKRNPYITCFPILLSSIDEYLEQKNGKGNLYCHTNYENQGFSTLEAFELVREDGHYTRIQKPLFRTCSEEPLIQLADVAGYLILQDLYSDLFSENFNPKLKGWFKRYVVPRMNWKIHNPSSGKLVSISMVTTEFIVTNGGGPAEYQRAVRATAPGVLRRSARGEVGGWYLTQDGFILGEPQIKRNLSSQSAYTNKPPSKDGDLYE